VAIVGVGPDDTRARADETQTEDVGLPEHERDEHRRAGGTGFAEESAGLSDDMDDSRLSESGLPAHEDDSRMAEDTGTGEQNP
jgi:hypothetical protein